MDQLPPEMSQPFVFKFPMGDSTDSNGIDLKWISEKQKETNEFFDEFSESYREYVKSDKHPIELLKAHFQIIQALSNYQIALIEQQKKRQGHIQSETDIHEMMSQLDNITKMFRGDIK